jgi:hypothetical protein
MGTESLWGSNEEALARTLLEPEQADLTRDARRFFAGLALASIFGLALGARFGAVSMAAHAVGVPLAIAVVALLGTPAFFVGILHGGFDVDARTLAASIARGAATAGLVLAGFSPAMALYSLSAEEPLSVGVLAALGLGVAGFLGQRATFRSLPVQAGSRGVGYYLFHVAFAAFAAVLAGRVWWLVLPIFGAGS